MFDPQNGYPAVVPYARYRDPQRAIDWLTAVVGARLPLRMPIPDGRIGHAELDVGRQVVSLGLDVHEQALPIPRDRADVRAMTLVFVPDVDTAAHRAVERGGTLVDAPTDMPWGVRQAIVADPEGHVWELSQYQRDVLPQDWGAETLD